MSCRTPGFSVKKTAGIDPVKNVISASTHVHPPESMRIDRCVQMHKNLGKLFSNLDINVVYDPVSQMYVDPDSLEVASDTKE